MPRAPWLSVAVLLGAFLGALIPAPGAAHEQLIRFALDAGEPIPSGVLFRPIAGHAEDVERYMRQDYTATSTDGRVSGFTRPGQHPRYYGAFVRKIAYYVKEQGVISLVLRSPVLEWTARTNRGSRRSGLRTGGLQGGYHDFQLRAARRPGDHLGA